MAIPCAVAEAGADGDGVTGAPPAGNGGRNGTLVAVGLIGTTISAAGDEARAEPPTIPGQETPATPTSNPRTKAVAACLAWLSHQAISRPTSARTAHVLAGRSGGSWATPLVTHAHEPSPSAGNATALPI